MVSNCYQDWYQGINIFGEWYHYNLAWVSSNCQPHASKIFQRIKWPNYSRLSPLRDSNGWLPRQTPHHVRKLLVPSSVHWPYHYASGVYKASCFVCFKNAIFHYANYFMIMTWHDILALKKVFSTVIRESIQGLIMIAWSWLAYV